MTEATLLFDTARNPPTWNFADALLFGEAWRRQHGFDRLMVKVSANGFRSDRLPPYGDDERARWRDNIVAPMAAMLPSCGKPAQLIGADDAPAANEFGRGAVTIGFKHLVAAARRNLYPFRANETRTEDYRRQFGRNYVTITLRDPGWWPARTSVTADWIKVAEGIRRRGLDVLFVRDAAQAGEPIDDWPVAPAVASVRSDERAAIYAGAVMNIGIVTGPLLFAWFMGVPVIAFDWLHDHVPCANAPFYARAGLPVGSQFANAKPGQWIHWGKASPAEVLATFDAVFADCERKTA